MHSILTKETETNSDFFLLDNDDFKYILKNVAIKKPSRFTRKLDLEELSDKVDWFGYNNKNILISQSYSTSTFINTLSAISPVTLKPVEGEKTSSVFQDTRNMYQVFYYVNQFKRSRISEEIDIPEKSDEFILFTSIACKFMDIEEVDEIYVDRYLDEYLIYVMLNNDKYDSVLMDKLIERELKVFDLLPNLFLNFKYIPNKFIGKDDIIPIDAKLIYQEQGAKIRYQGQYAFC